MDKVFKAWQFAHYHHSAVSQMRKYGGEPYIVHPVAVANILMMNVPTTENMIAAALLHDTVEDTNATLHDIMMGFGVEVADTVYWLTDVAVPEDGNRKTRMAINRDHIARGSDVAQTIKAADIIHNVKSIVTHNVGFAYKYVPEKRDVYHVLTRANPKMLQLLDETLTEAEDQLKQHTRSK